MAKKVRRSSTPSRKKKLADLPASRRKSVKGQLQYKLDPVYVKSWSTSG